MSSDEAGWVRAAASGEVAEGEVVGIAVGGRDIAIYNIDGGLFATDDTRASVNQMSSGRGRTIRCGRVRCRC